MNYAQGRKKRNIIYHAHYIISKNNRSLLNSHGYGCREEIDETRPFKFLNISV